MMQTSFLLSFIIHYLNAPFLVYSFDLCSENFEIVTDVKVDDCEPNHFFLPSGNPSYKCLPRCEKKYSDIGKIDCEYKGCPPGSHCLTIEGTADKRCQVDESSCFRYTVDVPNNKWFKSEWKPKCLTDGTWEAKQCKPNEKSGRCFCFDKRGKRIYGLAFANKADNMTCACSRKKIELTESDPYIYNSLHCDSIGNYEPLQCNSGQCWCVESKTGEITSEVVPERLMSHLPCYSEKENGKQYLRQCESEAYGKTTIIKELKVHGAEFANLPHILCDFDGTYGPYQIETSEVRCFWKDRTSLQAAKSLHDADLTKVTCNCVRDKKIYELAGMTQLLICENSGEYYPLQKTEDGEYYCVDVDGYRKTKNFKKLELSYCNTIEQ